MIMTFSNFTQVTVALLSSILTIQLAHLVFLLINRKKSAKNPENAINCILAKLNEFTPQLNHLSSELSELKNKPGISKIDTNDAYNMATQMLEKGLHVDKIIDQCGLSRGEVELLSVLCVKHNCDT